MRRVVGEVADPARRLRVAVDDAADLESHVRRVAEACAAARLLGGLRPDLGELRVGGVLRDRGEGAGELANAPLDGVPARLDDVPDPPDALVDRADLDQVVEDRLGPREPREPAERRGQGRRRLAVRGAQSHAGVGLEVEQAPVDLDVGGPLADGLDRRPERLVVEHAAVDEPRPRGREPRELVLREEPVRELVEVDGPRPRRASPGARRSSPAETRPGCTRSSGPRT